MGIDQLTLQPVQLGYLKILQMGNTDPKDTKAGKEIRDLSYIPKDIVFDARSIVSLSGEPVSNSGKKREMMIEFRLLCDILAKTISVKAGSFDAIIQEKFLMLAEIACGVKLNWSSMMLAEIACGVKLNWNMLLFNILKDMVTPGTRQAKGYAIQIRKTVHRYVVLNDKVGMEDVTDEPRVKKTPVRKAASKKRPDVTTVAEPVVKKKRTTKSKYCSSKDKLEIFPVAHEAVPLQIIAPTAAAPIEKPPSAPNRKIHKRKRRLVLGSNDDIVEQPAAEVAIETSLGEPVVEVTGESVVEESAVANVLEEQQVDTVVEGIAEPDSEPAVFAETAQIEPDKEEQDVGGSDFAGTAVSESGVGEQAAPKADELEQWFNLSYEEFHACLDADQPVVTASDTDEDLETVEEMETEVVEQSADEAMSMEDILMTIPVECPLPSANVEITKIILGKSISIPGVDEGDWYKAGLPKIPAADKGKAPVMERDPIKGNPVKEKFSLILADIETIPKETVLEMRRQFSGSDEPFRAPNKKREMKIKFRLLHDIVAKRYAQKLVRSIKSLDEPSASIVLVVTNPKTVTASENNTCDHQGPDSSNFQHHTTLLHEQLKNAVDGLDIKIDVLERTLSKRMDDSHHHFTQLETNMVHNYVDSHQQLVDELASVKSHLAAMVESIKEFGADKNG
ncbi:hypothetical protein F511_16503 [Dorcoceras hygrometricum]|uniref:Uncharacterized protein n=1 Tax=Dorcoceras hygrometricum TaxID=472368 RepID=A0A2Z7BXS2_9LAMI|nr:hypothetical protein F511_16503 [Dorcoceras hygrometricum]